MTIELSNSYWKTELKGKIDEPLAIELDQFETELLLKKQGKIDDKLFAETRLRRGAYGQRYDNGQRHDGTQNQQIPFPSKEKKWTKGPNTVWDAPGMLRIKIPFGGLCPEQMEMISDLAQEYSDAICHVTTRQDFQLHFIHIEDTPTIMRRLGSVGITTREACGNVVRNVTGCPVTGVCPTEAFDVTPYADALMKFLLGHPDTQDFGRKFKPSFSGCKGKACGLARMHDIGFIASIRNENGKEIRGFETYVGGGLGATPFQAKLFDAFVSEEEILPLTQAVARVFSRLGERENRAKARLKYLVQKLGIEEFRNLVLEERKKLKFDPKWTEFLGRLHEKDEEALKEPGICPDQEDISFQRWKESNVMSQKQDGFSAVTVQLPLGDISASQFRALALVTKKFIKGTIRTTVEQNIVLRWVSNADLPALYQELKALDLADDGAGTIIDITACPGTDTCKLGISSSRGLAAELRRGMTEKAFQYDAVLRNLKIKISGCFNSCGQHHLCDIGFYGVSRKSGEYMLPHFQLMLGGLWEDNGGAYALAVGTFPSKAIPSVVNKLCEMYLKGRQEQESFRNFIARLGKVKVKASLESLTRIPSHDENPSFYQDWADVREYSLSDKGVGECAGELVSLTDFGLKNADREIFKAQLLLDEENPAEAVRVSFQSMTHAAQALIKTYDPDISEEAKVIVEDFKKRFCDTKIFYDQFGGARFANFIFKAYEDQGSEESLNPEDARIRVEEAQLFLDAAHSCNIKLSIEKQTVGV